MAHVYTHGEGHVGALCMLGTHVHAHVCTHVCMSIHMSIHMTHVCMSRHVCIHMSARQDKVDTAMAYIVMAYTGQSRQGMAYIVMAYKVTAYGRKKLTSQWPVLMSARQDKVDRAMKGMQPDIKGMLKGTYMRLDMCADVCLDLRAHSMCSDMCADIV